MAAVARLYDDVTVLEEDNATTKGVLDALDGAWLAHIAAHGSFRADSPLFSSLRMHDGPLTVYDFEQLRSAPYRLILSSCDSGVVAPVGADELLGLVSSLLPLGTAGIIAGVVPLNDYAVVPVMTDLHRHLRAARDPRRGAAHGPVRPRGRSAPAGDSGVLGGPRRGLTRGARLSGASATGATTPSIGPYRAGHIAARHHAVLRCGAAASGDVCTRSPRRDCTAHGLRTGRSARPGPQDRLNTRKQIIGIVPARRAHGRRATV